MWRNTVEQFLETDEQAVQVSLNGHTSSSVRSGLDHIIKKSEYLGKVEVRQRKDDIYLIRVRLES